MENNERRNTDIHFSHAITKTIFQSGESGSIKLYQSVNTKRCVCEGDYISNNKTSTYATNETSINGRDW